MYPELTIACPSQWIWKFHTLLQKGFKVRCRVNGHLIDLLRETFKLGSAYIHQRIQTITLNGRPVDDPAKAIVPDSAVLAISGAMPGLVGATLRKGGYYAAMRSTVTYSSKDHNNASVQQGLITIKLFNLILKDQAASFLARGIGTNGKDLAPIIDDLQTLPENPIESITLEGKALQWPAGRDLILEEELVFATVRTEQRNNY